MPIIYLADSDAGYRASLAELLRGTGASVVELASGHDLYEKLTGSSPDLVVMDPDLPGMHGFQLVVDLPARSRGKQPGVVFVTRFRNSRVAEVCLSRGVLDYLEKERPLGEVAARIERLLPSSGPPAPTARRDAADSRRNLPGRIRWRRALAGTVATVLLAGLMTVLARSGGEPRAEPAAPPGPQVTAGEPSPDGRSLASRERRVDDVPRTAARQSEPSLASPSGGAGQPSADGAARPAQSAPRQASAPTRTAEAAARPAQSAPRQTSVPTGRGNAAVPALDTAPRETPAATARRPQPSPGDAGRPGQQKPERPRLAAATANPQPPVAAPVLAGLVNPGDSRILLHRASGRAEVILPWADQSLLGSADRVEVRLRVLVDQQGHVERSQIERSSGDPQIDARAVAAARRLRYRPGRQDGLPVEAWRSQVLAVRRD